MSMDLATYENNGTITTISESSVDDKLRVVEAVNSATSLNDYVESEGKDAVITLADVFTMPGVRKARGAGQTDTPCNNTYLITTDGECFMTQSDGIYRSVAAIVAAFPDLRISDDAQGFPVRVVEKKLRNGNTVKTLVPVR